jgi:hypothetical protein
MNRTAQRFATEFTGAPVGLTAPYRYQIIELPSLHKLQLWYLAPGRTVWEVGHSKEIPAGHTAKHTAEVMRGWITGVLTAAQYRQLLPY